jgi:hypothetical protein
MTTPRLGCARARFRPGNARNDRQRADPLPRKRRRAFHLQEPCPRDASGLAGGWRLLPGRGVADGRVGRAGRQDRVPRQYRVGLHHADRGLHRLGERRGRVHRLRRRGVEHARQPERRVSAARRGPNRACRPDIGGEQGSLFHRQPPPPRCSRSTRTARWQGTATRSSPPRRPSKPTSILPSRGCLTSREPPTVRQTRTTRRHQRAIIMS